MTNITLGQAINESFSSTDTKNPKRLGSFSDDYTLSGFSNWQQVQVNMESTAIDSYLQLVNASTGEVIAFNDGFTRDNKNSQLKFTVIPGVNYAIRATSFNANETGNYTIKTSSLGTASSLVVTERGRAGTVDPLGRFVPIGTFATPESQSRSFNDIAFSSDNKLLSINKDSGSKLYSLNPGSGSSSLIGNFPSDVTMTSLEFSPNGTLYGASDSPALYTINPQTGAASSVADFITFFGPTTYTRTDLVFDPVNNRFLFVELGVLFSVSLTGESTLIADTGFNRLRGLSFEGSTLVGFESDRRIIINPTTAKGTLDKNITGLEYRNELTVVKFADIETNDGILGAASIPSVTLTPTPTPTPTPPTVVTPTPTPPTVVTPTPTPPTVVTPTPTPPTVVTPTPTPPTVVTPTPLIIPIPKPTPNNTQQPSTNSSSISITSASDLEDGDKTLVPGGTIVVSSLATGINNASSNLPSFLRDNLKAFLGDNPIPVNFVRISAGSNPVQFDTEINLPNNISPGNYPLKLTLNTGTGSPISAVGPTFDISIPPLGSSLSTPFKIGKLSQSQDTFNFVDSTNTSDFFRFSLTNRSSFNLLLNPQNAGKPSGDATVLLRSTNGQVLEGGTGIQIGKTSFISRELPADDYLIEVKRKPNASDEKIDYNLRTSAIGLTESENQTLILKSPSEIEGFVTNDVIKDGLIDTTPKLKDEDKDKERLKITISNRNGSPITSIDPNKETWIVVHGNADSPKFPKMSALADAVAEYKKKQNNNEEPQVLVVDWSQPADNNDKAGFRPDLAAEWVNKVAEFAVHSLKDIWGIPANKINLVGHSLGTFVSGLIAENYLKYTQSRINKLILLDSAKTLKTDAGSLFNDPGQIGQLIADSLDYDLDGSQPETQSPPKFSEVATFSRSIWGDFAEGNGLGSPRYNETADESIKVKFKGSKSIIEGRLELSERLVLGDGLTNHGDLVYLFSNILKSEDAIGSKLSLDAPLNKEWRNIPGGPEAILEAEKPGDLDAKKNDKGAKAATLIAKNPDSSGNKDPFLEINEDDIVYGTNGKDTLDGFDFITQVQSQIFYLGGSSLYTGRGNDIFYGEAGDDLIFGGDGNDTINGYLGNDTINGEEDNDLIEGGDDNDTILGGKGDDTVKGDIGNDSLEGNDGKDTLIGGENNDTLWGGGDDSPDSLVGGGGNDYIRGQKGNDTINGDQGNDFINGEKGNDSIFGGDNNDTIFGAIGEDTIDGGEGNDSLEGNDGKDTLIGGDNDDTLWGGGDDSPDSLEGGDGNDYLFGEGGDDILIGGKGKDIIDCGGGNDTLVFGLDDGSASRDGADIITNFRTGKLLGFISTGDTRGVTKIKLNGLTPGNLEVMKIDNNKTLLWSKKNDLDLYTAFKQDTYFAILDGSFNKDQLTFI
jgi:Ca2+-binding RTX toxin-like protein